AIVLSSTSAIVYTNKRITNPPIATANRIDGEIRAAHATDTAAATKFASTITTATAADQAASLPPITPPRMNAPIRATGANASTRRRAACSGSTFATVAPPIPQIDDVHAASPADDDPDRQEHLV